MEQFETEIYLRYKQIIERDCHSSSRHDLFASDIETCKHVSASLGSSVIPGACPRLTGMTGNLLEMQSVLVLFPYLNRAMFTWRIC